MSTSINDIKNTVKSLEGEALETYIHSLQDDKRQGVQNIIQSYQKQKEKHEKEIARINAMIEFDRNSLNKAGFIAGIDEVGRGPLAGPVVTACVVMDESSVIEGVNDSKKLSHEKREQLYDIIVKHSKYCAIGLVENEKIDEINILNATFLAMRSAISHVSNEMEKDDRQIDLILVDGNQAIKGLEIAQKTVVSGDSKSYSIACASIVAKVYRDRLMEKYDLQYPGYDFAQNKGYGTEAHYEGLKKLGFTPIHRKSFCKSLF